MGRQTTLGKLPDGTPFYCINKMEMLFCYKEIFDSVAYESSQIKISDGDVILDVGANIGLFLLYISRRAANCTLYAFEPIPRIFSALSQNTPQFKGHDVRLSCCGLSDQPGEATFTFLRNVTARSTMFPEQSPADTSPESRERELGFMLQTFKQVPNAPLRWSLAALPGFARRRVASGLVKFHAKKRRIKCPLKTLSQIVDENRLDRIDLLKIDVEGAERDVLRGVRDEHWPLIRQLIVETHPGPGDVLSDVRSALENRGFRTVVTDQTLHPAPTVFATRP
jgi:FkbM family methyltransferase